MSAFDIVDGRMLTRLSRFFPQVVTIQERAAGSDRAGQPNGAWSNVTGLVNIPCNVGMPGGGESRTQSAVALHEDAEILMGYQSTAITTAYRAVVTGGLTYDILSVETDPLQKLTRLRVQKATT